MPTPHPPYVLDTPVFRFGKVAAHVGRASVGGGREVALATYLAARMVHDMLPERAIDATLRRERAAAAKGWFASVALTAPMRTAFSDLAAATGGSLADVGPLLQRVITVTAQSLDAGARSELERLAMRVQAQSAGKT